MKSLLDLLNEESSLINEYNRHMRNADCWASEKAHCNSNSELGIERDDYQHYTDLEKESRDKAAKCMLEIAEVRGQIVKYLSNMIEIDRKRKSLFAGIFKK